MPEWAAEDPRLLFAAADAFERVNGRLYIHVWVALPNELDESERHALAQAIGVQLTAAGLPYVYAVHAGEPTSAGEPANPHVHLVISERLNDGVARDARLWFRRANPRHPASGGAAKDRAVKEVTWVDDARKVIERVMNEHLSRAGCQGRVTADSHATRIVEAEAWGDEATAEYLRRHPPGLHLGPAAAAMERDRYRGKRGEERELARAGERTERGDLARAKAAEEERIQGELQRVGEALRRAREEERRARESASGARRAGFRDDEIVEIYERAESSAPGSGWAAVDDGAAAQTKRKEKAEAEARRLGINAEAVLRSAKTRGENGVDRLEAVVGRVDRLLRIERDVRATRMGPEWLSEETKRTLQGADRKPTLRERERIVSTVHGWIRDDLHRRQQELHATEYGTWFLTEARRSAGDVKTLAAAERLLDAAKERLGEHQADEARLYADTQRLFEQPGAEELYYAVLTGLDPLWRVQGETTEVNLKTALETASSDSARLGLLQDVLADPVAAAGYRDVLDARGENITVKNLDAALEAGLRERAEAERKREKEAARKRKEEERRATRRAALSPAGRELFAAWLTDLTAARRHANGPSMTVVDQALDATESDGRLPRLEAVSRDAVQGYYYRSALDAAADPSTLERIDAALQATARFEERKNRVFQYPGGRKHPSGKELWAAELQELSAAGLDAALTRVESRLGERVRQAADEVEKGLDRRPDDRVPALPDERLDQLDQLGGDAFIRATIAEVRARYARRARSDTPPEDRYCPSDRFESEQARLARDIEMTWDRELRLWSSYRDRPRPTSAMAMARVVKKYLSKVWKVFRVACNRILGGNLGERLRRRREQLERAADTAERLLPTTPSGRADLRVPAVPDQALAGIVIDKRAAVVRVAEIVWDRYDHRSLPERPSAQRYDAEDRDASAQAYLASAVAMTQARQESAWLRPDAPPGRPTRAARASVAAGHQARLREIFEVACDEVLGEGELAARWRRQRDQVQRATDAAERELRTRHLVPVSDETLDDLVATETDPFRKEMFGVVWERYYRRALLESPDEERYDAEDRSQAELAHLDDAIEQTLAQQQRLWRSTTGSERPPTWTSARASVLKDHRTRIRDLFTAARDDVLRVDEQRDRQPTQPARPAGASTERGRVDGPQTTRSMTRDTNRRGRDGGSGLGR